MFPLARCENAGLLCGEVSGRPPVPTPSYPHPRAFFSCACSEDLTTTLVGKHQATVRHLPGYTGHVPTLRSRIGQTYGFATGELVERPIMAKADRKLLNKVRG